VDSALHDYLSEVFPTGSDIKIQESCGGSLGLSATVAVFEVVVANDDPASELTRFAPEDGTWTRQASLQEFVDAHGEPVGLAATVLDGKACQRKLRNDANALLFEQAPGLYFRSHDQTAFIMMPDDEPGTGVVFVQGR
jgi:hypothetical protein